MNVSFSMEFRRAWRRLRRAPGFSLSVIVLIALSLGGVAAVGTAGWSLFGKPLPYAQAGQLVTLSAFSGRFGMHMGLSEALVEELDRVDEIAGLGIIGQPFDLPLDDGRRLRAASIDHRLVEVFGLAPVAGRTFNAGDTRPGADPVALISARTWREQFASRPGLIGRVIELEDSTVRVIGVLPDKFAIPESGTGIWLPMELGPDKIGPQSIAQFGSLTVIARSAGDFTPAQLEQRLRGRLGSDERLQGLRQMLEIEYRVRPLRELWSSGQRQGLMILGSATLVVLLAAWLNLAGLWLARWTGRDHELAVQAALGARRGQALVGVCLEYVLLGVPGGVLALLVAALGLDALYALGVLEENGPLRATVSMPTWLAGAALLGAGLIPILATLAWQTRRVAGNSSQFLGGRGLGARSSGARLRQGLMIGQIGIAFSLLVTLGLLLASWLNLLDQELGFEKNRLVAASITTPQPGPPATDAGVAAVVERLRSLPGVDGVSWTNVVPFGRSEMLSSISLEDRPDEPLPVRPRSAGEDFFRVAGIELLAGRRFGPEDAGDAVATVIVDKAFEDAYLGGSALGRRFGMADGPDSHDKVMIVGVVASVRHMSPDEQDANPTVYTFSPAPQSQQQILMRTSIEPSVLVRDVQTLIERELGEDRIDFAATLDALVRRTVNDREPQLALLGTFSGLALVLVFYGLYALQSYNVAAGTAEIGLRKALGATERSILVRTLARSAWLLPPGLIIGALAGWLATWLVGERLYQVSLFEPWLWLAAAAAIGATLVLASLAPALRATRVQPLEALDYE